MLAVVLKTFTATHALFEKVPYDTLKARHRCSWSPLTVTRQCERSHRARYKPPGRAELRLIR